VSDLGTWLRIDPSAAKPPFDQLRTQIIDGIRDGRLPAGTRLPTVRELAAEAGVAVNTAARAYRELETAGLVETRGRRGSFVAAADATDIAMVDAAQAFADTVRAFGLTREDAIRYLDAALR
jgi:DNA-binding transcriptional regulator YhcF (GntR family)